MTRTESIVFDRIADRYDETRGGDARGAELVAELGPHLAAGSVLEVGVGTGIMAAALVRAGRQVFGVDLSGPMLAKAYRRIGPRLAAADARALPVASDAVDNVLFCWVLHLVGDLPRAVAEAARVVRPGGRVVAVHGQTTVSSSDLDVGYDLLKPLVRQRPDDPASLDATAGAAGLRLVLDGLTGPRELSVAPATMAQQVEERVWSYLWQCSADEWQDHAVPAIAALRALPDPERPRRYTVRQSLRVYAA
jgi:SAM-dependent methyltransferase